MNKMKKGTVLMWITDENAKKSCNRNNSADDKGETNSSNDNKQEEENAPTTEISENCSPGVTTTEIQDQPSVQGKLSQFLTFAGCKIKQKYQGERIKKGARVIKRKNESTPTSNRIWLGTIHEVSKNGVDVQWDNSDKQEQFSVEKDQFDLLLFDNAHTGVKHTHSTCNACNKHPLSGIRWKCLNCDDIDLCTLCYMCDAHDVSHFFNRIESKDSKGEKVPPREDIQWTGYKYVCGILENADVSRRNKNKLKGNVLQIYEYGTGLEELCELRSENDVKEQKLNDNFTIVTKDYIEVQWDIDNTTSLHNVFELKCENPALHPCYPDHLPILENDTRGQLEVLYGTDNEQKKPKIVVDIWYRIKMEKKDSYKPILYLIFANENGDEHTQFAIMNEVLEFSSMEH